MDRSREARRAAAMATTNGLPRRRHRTSSLRDSPEDDGPLEFQEPARLRDRTGKKERDRDRDRDRDRSERDRSSRMKRRRGDKYLHGGSHRDDAGDGSSEDESVNDDDDEDLDDSSIRYVVPPPTNPVPLSSSSSPSSALTSHRKSYPPPSKVFRVTPSWKAPDEMIGFSVPRKARSASTKRSHDCWNSGVPVDTIHRQASASPVRPNMVGGSSVAGSPSPAPMSPSSSSITSMKKKMMANGPKHRPSKTVPKSPPSIQDDIEIEVAEVLFGLMRQSQASSKQDVTSNDSARLDSRDVNRSVAESKSRVSSPISNAGSAPAQNSPAMPQNSSSLQPSLAVVAPKRKRPRPVNQPEENPTVYAVKDSPISTSSKAEPDLLAKHEVRTPNMEKNAESAAQNGGVLFSSGNLSSPWDARPEPVKPEKEEKYSEEQSRSKEAVKAKVEEASASNREYVEGRVDSAASQAILAAGGKESRREEKFEIDLMAPPPQSRLSPERAVEIDNRHQDLQQERMAVDRDAELFDAKPVEDVSGGKPVSTGNGEWNGEETKAKSMPLEEGEAEKLNLNSKVRIIDLQIDLEKVDKIGASGGADDIKLNQLQTKPLPAKTPKDDASADKAAQSCNIPMSMSVPPGWPGGLPPMGYVAPLQGVVSMDGNHLAPAAIQPPSFTFSQPRPRRCGYHCYIAKNVQNHQQLMKNYPFWPAPATGNPLFGAKPYNLNMVPPADLHPNAGSRGGVVGSVQDKGQAVAFFPGQTAGKDKSAPAANIGDNAQKKQFFLQPSLPPGAASNILHGPAFIFPLGQQQAAAAANASAHANSGSKSPMPAGSAVNLGSTSNPAVIASATAGQPTQTMSFNFPNMPANETQYLAILGNSPYPFPIPAHVGAAPPYRGAHPQAMPFFNGSFYPSQILHPSQLQQQQQQQPSSQSAQIQQQSHQNPSISSASSSSQKQMQNQQQRPQGSSAPNGGSLQPFSAPKNRPLQAQQQHEMGSEESPSTADSHVSRPPLNMGVYGQNFTLPFNPQNFALLAPHGSLNVPTNASSNGNHGDKKQPQLPTQPQQAALKAGIESLAPQTFAMSFSPINGATTSGFDISSLAQNHAILQSLPEAARHNYQIMTAAAAAQHAAQQKKSSGYRGGSEDGKQNDSAANVDDERKSMGVNRPGSATSMGQSITFSRPDLAESSVTNSVVDSSARNLNLVPGPARPRSSVANAPNTAPVSEPQHQQLLQLQKQQQFAAAAAARTKNPPTSNGSVFSDHQQHLSSHSMAAKFPNALSGFSPSLVHQSGNSPVQSPQWKGSGRTGPSHVSSPSLAGATTSSSTMKSLAQQQAGRISQQGQQTQISFSGGGNLKPTSSSQGQQQVGAGCQTQSPPLLVGSPSTTSASKGASGSPRTATSTSTNKPASQPSALSAHQGKNSSPSLPSQKSSTVVGRNAPSLLGSPHVQTTNISVGNKTTQLQQSQVQIQQPQLSKQSIQQAQLFFSSSYMQQAPVSSGQSAPGGFYLQRHRPDQQPSQVPQQPTKSQVGGHTSTSSASSGVVLPLGSVSLTTSTSTSDAAKAASTKGQGILHAAQFAASQTSGGVHHQLVPAGFPYVHAVPTAGSAAVQVKPTEQKQPAG